MIGLRQRIVSLMRRPLALIVAAAIVGMAMTAWGSTTTSVTWTAKEDFENNASTTGTPTTRLNIDTTTSPGDVRIGVTKDFVTTATITCVTSGNKIYTTGVDRTSIAVIDAATKALIRTIPLPGRAAGVIYNSANNKLYVGQYNDNNVSVIDIATDTVIHTLTSGAAGNGAYAAAYNLTNNKVYIANTGDQTVTIFDGVSDSPLVTVPVTAGATTASFDVVAGKLYLTSKANQFMTIIDGVTDQVVNNVEIETPVNLLGGQLPDNVGLRVDAPAKGITSAEALHLSWNYDCLGEDQKIQFQVRTAQDIASLDSALYKGPDGTAGSWYETVCTALTETPQTTSVDLNLTYMPAAEIQVKLSSDGLSTPVLHAVTLEYESYPDLVVNDVSGPATATIGSTISVSTTVANNGPGEAPASKVGFSLYKGTTLVYTFPDGDTPLLLPLASYAGNVSLTIPTIATGDYIFKTCADPDPPNLIAEKNEFNNCDSYPISIYSVQPDLVVKSVSGTVSNGQLTYSVTIKNQGINAAPAFWTTLYLSSDAIITTLDYTPGIAINSSGVAGGAETTLTGTLTIPVMPNGNYYVGAIADYNNLVPEADETNNSLSSTSSQYIYVDLTVTAVSGPVANGQLNYSVTVRNNGNGRCPTFSTAFYLSPDTTITTSDYAGASAVSSSVPAGSSEKILTGITNIPVMPNGNYYVGAIADFNNLVSETDESNNSLSSTSLVYIYVDLAVTTFSGTVANGQLNYSVTVRNNGNGRCPTFSTAFYLSPDTTITTSDYAGASAVSSSVPAGSSEKILTGITNIPVMPNGNYYVGAIADFNNLVSETDESNNSPSSTSPVYIYVDLAVTAVSGTVANGQLTYSVTVANNGNGRCPSFSTAFYLSPDTTITTSDYAGASAVSSSVQAGSSEKILTGITNIPVMPNGNYYVGAIADFNNLISETDETNNSLAGNQVTIP